MLTNREPKSAVLRSIVDRVWCVSDAAADGFETCLPSGRVQILFSLSGTALSEGSPDDPQSGPLELFQGPTTRPRRVSCKPRVSACGVSFRPGGAGAVFGPIDGTADRIIDLSQYWGIAGAQLREELRHIRTHEARLDRLESEIERRVSDPTTASALGRGIERLRAGATIKKVCREMELSPHSFRKLFHRNVGLMPKLFLRIERFRMAITDLSPTVPLTDLAIHSHYADQSHMTREVAHFASMTPGCLRSSVRPYVGHVQDPRR